MNAQISGSVNSAVDEHQSHVQVPDIYASQISVIIERFSKVTLLYWIDEIERRRETLSKPKHDKRIANASKQRVENRSSPPGSVLARGKGIYVCPDCHERLGTRKEFRRHMNERERKWRCPSCDISYTRKDRLVRHHKNKHGSGIPNHTCLANAEVSPTKSAFACVYCPTCFDNSQEWTDHLIEHLDDSNRPSPSDETKLHGLLQHPPIATLWKAVRGARSCEKMTLSWDMNDTEVLGLINCLEKQRMDDHDGLESLLTALLENTNQLKWLKKMQPMSTIGMYVHRAELDKAFCEQASDYHYFGDSTGISAQDQSIDGLNAPCQPLPAEYDSTWMHDGALFNSDNDVAEPNTHGNGCIDPSLTIKQHVYDGSGLVSLTEQHPMAPSMECRSMYGPVAAQAHNLDLSDVESYNTGYNRSFNDRNTTHLYHAIEAASSQFPSHAYCPPYRLDESGLITDDSGASNHSVPTPT